MSPKVLQFKFEFPVCYAERQRGRGRRRERERGRDTYESYSFVSIVCLGLCLRFQLVSPIPGPMSASGCLLPGVALITLRYVIALKMNDPSLHRYVQCWSSPGPTVFNIWPVIVGTRSTQLPKRPASTTGRLIKTHFKFIEQMFALKQNVCKMLKETTHTFYFVL